MSALMLCAASALFAGHSAFTATEETRYTATLSDDLRAMYAKLGVPAPERRLVLRSDGTCDLANGSDRQTGRYTLSGDMVGLVFDKSSDVMMRRLANGRILLNGVSYDPLPDFEPGQWTVRRAGYEDTSMRFTFDAKGTFAFEGMGVTSKGRWNLEGGSVVLRWSEIDGQPVERGSVISKRVPLRGSGFDIDQYHYERRS